jgi:2-polyprenyl-3-methyl-5-hydroxy-6-metoxy-1,4-benzoquinol methylase
MRDLSHGDSGNVVVVAGAGHRRGEPHHLCPAPMYQSRFADRLHQMDDYRELNRANWDERAPAHAASPSYAVAQFVADPAFLSEVVRFDLPLIGDLSGIRGVHLQCHIGTDTISLARLGARMTGLDFSPVALVEARRLSERTGAGVDFVESDL